MERFTLTPLKPDQLTPPNYRSGATSINKPTTGAATLVGAVLGAGRFGAETRRVFAGFVGKVRATCYILRCGISVAAPLRYLRPTLEDFADLPEVPATCQTNSGTHASRSSRSVTQETYLDASPTHKTNWGLANHPHGTRGAFVVRKEKGPD